MKRIVAALTALLLAVCALPALAVEGYLTADEVQDFCADLLHTALAMEAVAPEEAEEGGWRFDFGAFALRSTDETLTADSPILQAELLPGEETLTDMRGIGPGSGAEDLLAAYPLDNPDLAGLYDEAALYVDGDLPGTAYSGYVVRSGSHLLLAAHSTYTVKEGRALQTAALYTLENNRVTAVQLLPAFDAGSVEEAREELARLTALREEKAYTAYRAETPTPLAREDLFFGPIDFISATEADLTAALGTAEGDTWEADEEGYLRTLQWEGVQAILRYDASRQNASLEYIQIYSERLEGPRGMHLEDSMADVLALFPQEGEGDVLYGDGDNAPTGVISYGAEEISLLYAAEVEGGQVLLKLDFVDDALWVISCLYL